VKIARVEPFHVEWGAGRNLPISSDDFKKNTAK
jgi:hypothetical protein